jgi:hypothetical protein
VDYFYLFIYEKANIEVKTHIMFPSQVYILFE